MKGRVSLILFCIIFFCMAKNIHPCCSGCCGSDEGGGGNGGAGNIELFGVDLGGIMNANPMKQQRNENPTFVVEPNQAHNPAAHRLMVKEKKSRGFFKRLRSAFKVGRNCFGSNCAHQRRASAEVDVPEGVGNKELLGPAMGSALDAAQKHERITGEEERGGGEGH